MGIAELVDLLLAQGRSQAISLREAASAEAATLRAKSQAELAHDEQLAMVEREAALRRAMESRLAEGERQARRRVLEARQAMLERVRTAILEALPELEASAEWRAQLPELVARLQVAAGAPLVIHCRNSNGIPEVEGVRIAVSEGAVPGLLGVTQDGWITVDGTLPALLDRQWPALAVAVLARVEAA